MLKKFVEFVSKCPILSNSQINVNYLDSMPGSVSVEPQGEAEIVKQYISGERLLRRVFKIALRGESSRRKDINMQYAQRMEELAQWLCTNTLEMGDISVISMPEAEYSASSATRISLTAEVIYAEA